MRMLSSHKISLAKIEVFHMKSIRIILDTTCNDVMEDKFSNKNFVRKSIRLIT